MISSEMEFVVGDLIKTYHKGFHTVLHIEPRYVTQHMIDSYPSVYGTCNVGDEYSPIITYESTFNSKFERVGKPIQNSCDAVYCVLITSEYVDSLIKPLEDLKHYLTNQG